ERAVHIGVGAKFGVQVFIGLNGDKTRAEQDGEQDAKSQSAWLSPCAAADCPEHRRAAGEQEHRADDGKWEFGRFNSAEGPRRTVEANVKVTGEHGGKERAFSQNQEQDSPFARGTSAWGIEVARTVQSRILRAHFAPSTCFSGASIITMPAMMIIRPI